MKNENRVLGAICSTPRGFTSLMMNISERAVGEDRIIGQKFGMIENQKVMLEQLEGETDEHYKMRMYITEGYPKNSKEAMEHYVNMNPNGFYEHPMWTVRGIHYTPRFAKEIEELEKINPEKPKVIKLVITGLCATDPKYLKWVVYSMRHPWDVAKSQEDLTRKMKFTLQDGRVVDLFEGQRINDPNSYIQNIVQFAFWRKNNPDIPIYFMNADDLIYDSKNELKKIADFTGEDYLKGLDIIDPKLANRGKSKEREPREGIWQDAIYVHECLLAQDFDKIMKFSLDKTTWYAKRNAMWFCPRIHASASYLNCFDCLHKDSDDFIRNSIKHAEINGYDWKNEPCPMECGFDPDDKNPKTIEESIKNNHWLRHCD